MRDKRLAFAIHQGNSPFESPIHRLPEAAILVVPLLLIGLALLAAADPSLSGVALAAAPAAATVRLSTEDLEALDAKFEEYSKTIHEKIEAKTKARADDLTEKLEKIEADIAADLTKLQEWQKKAVDEAKAADARLLELEQKTTKAGNLLNFDPERHKSPGQQFVESENYKRAVESGSEVVPKTRIQGGFLNRPAPSQVIVNAAGLNQPLVPEDRVAGIFIDPAERLLTVRNLLPVDRTDSNMVTFVRETLFTNNAAPQGAGTSPLTRENVAKAESNMTFELDNAPVETIAHWIRASKQVLADASQLRGHIDRRMRYGLKLQEEIQLLLGDGAAPNLSGLVTEAQAYDAGLDVANDTAVDKLRHAIFQVLRDGEYAADGMVLSHEDWHTIELLKVNPGTDDRYVWANPTQMAPPRLWGLPVVPTNTMTAGTFLVGAFQLASQIWDREDVTVEVSRNYNDDFIRNMVVILVEERITLTTYRPQALVTGSF